MQIVHAFFLSNLLPAAHRVRAFQHTASTTGASANSMGVALDDTTDGSDPFFPDRFMRDALFLSAIANELLIQSFFARR